MFLYNEENIENTENIPRDKADDIWDNLYLREFLIARDHF